MRLLTPFRLTVDRVLQAEADHKAIPCVDRADQHGELDDLVCRTALRQQRKRLGSFEFGALALGEEQSRRSSIRR